METIKNKNRRQRGAAAIITALCTVILLGVAAFAVDIAIYFLRLNELQNAADAGALAGARALYDPVTKSINTNANQVGHDIAEENVAQSTPVEVNWDQDLYNSDSSYNNDPNTGVRRGHWSFYNRKFTPNSSEELINILDYTTEQLDDPNSGFVNAVEVTAWRDAVPVVSFFASIFGIKDLKMKATAVAYLGFAGYIESFEVDLPIALCEDTLLFEDGNYNCTIGRMMNNGSKTATNDTARWTDFSDTRQCEEGGGVNTDLMRDAVTGEDDDCNGGNPEPIPFGTVIATGEGGMTDVMPEIRKCFEALYDEVEEAYHMWSAKLPVVNCTNDDYTANCSPVVGVAGVHILWVNDQHKKKYEFVPKYMYGPEDEYGDPILDEYSNPVFLNWPGDSPPGYGTPTYENVDRDALASLIAVLYEYYYDTDKNAFKDLTEELDMLYPGGWTVENLFVDGDGAIVDTNPDPNITAILKEKEVDGKARWASFILHFHLNNVDKNLETGELETRYAPWNEKSIYFLPSCEVDVDTGGTGGKNFGILAKTPLLVD